MSRNQNSMGRIGWLIAFVALIGTSACVAVKPYERELLAQPGMSFSPDPGNDSFQHALESREGAFGGNGASGGGCGCN
jgi:hypothetical protein